MLAVTTPLEECRNRDPYVAHSLCNELPNDLHEPPADFGKSTQLVDTDLIVKG